LADYAEVNLRIKKRRLIPATSQHQLRTESKAVGKATLDSNRAKYQDVGLGKC